VELFVVLLVIAILVGLAIPRFHKYKRRYYIATMVSDLRNLASTEEAYWSDVGIYTNDKAALKFVESPGVTVTMLTADSTGWSAKATFATDPAVCSVYYGAATPVPPATTKNFIGCTN
jgi:Tfp pilus assembly protein PilE